MWCVWPQCHTVQRLYIPCLRTQQSLILVPDIRFCSDGFVALALLAGVRGGDCLCVCVFGQSVCVCVFGQSVCACVWAKCDCVWAKCDCVWAKCDCVWANCDCVYVSVFGKHVGWVHGPLEGSLVQLI